MSAADCFFEYADRTEHWYDRPTQLGLLEAFAGKHVLLTGGTGFFGRWLLAAFKHLVTLGCPLTVTVVSRQPQLFLERYPDLCHCAWLQWVEGDIRTFELTRDARVDWVIHAAADTSAAAGANPLELFDSIIEGARHVFDQAIDAGASRFLLTGSGAQYGALPVSSGVQENFSGACISHSMGSAYGEAKRAQETLASIYAGMHSLEVVYTRCFAFSGPGLPVDGHFAIGNFVRDALLKDEVVLNSDGTAIRSYLHGSDLAIWLLLLLAKGQAGEAYNVGSDQAISIAQLAHRVVAQVSPDKVVRILGQDPGGQRSFYVPNIQRAAALGLACWTGLDQSINSMAQWLQSAHV